MNVEGAGSIPGKKQWCKVVCTKGKMEDSRSGWWWHKEDKGFLGPWNPVNHWPLFRKWENYLTAKKTESIVQNFERKRQT